MLIVVVKATTISLARGHNLGFLEFNIRVLFKLTMLILMPSAAIHAKPIVSVLYFHC